MEQVVGVVEALLAAERVEIVTPGRCGMQVFIQLKARAGLDGRSGAFGGESVLRF